MTMQGETSFGEGLHIPEAKPLGFPIQTAHAHDYISYALEDHIGCVMSLPTALRPCLTNYRKRRRNKDTDPDSRSRPENSARLADE